MNSHVYMLARVRRRGTRGAHWGSRHGCGGCDDHLKGAYPIDGRVPHRPRNRPYDDEGSAQHARNPLAVITAGGRDALQCGRCRFSHHKPLALFVVEVEHLTQRPRATARACWPLGLQMMKASSSTAASPMTRSTRATGSCSSQIGMKSANYWSRTRPSILAVLRLVMSSGGSPRGHEARCGIWRRPDMRPTGLR